MKLALALPPEHDFQSRICRRTGALLSTQPSGRPRVPFTNPADARKKSGRDMSDPSYALGRSRLINMWNTEPDNAEDAKDYHKSRAKMTKLKRRYRVREIRADGTEKQDRDSPKKKRRGPYQLPYNWTPRYDIHPDAHEKRYIDRKERRNAGQTNHEERTRCEEGDSASFSTKSCQIRASVNPSRRSDQLIPRSSQLDTGVTRSSPPPDENSRSSLTTEGIQRRMDTARASLEFSPNDVRISAEGGSENFSFNAMPPKCNNGMSLGTAITASNDEQLEPFRPSNALCKAASDNDELTSVGVTPLKPKNKTQSTKKCSVADDGQSESIRWEDGFPRRRLGFGRRALLSSQEETIDHDTTSS